MFHLETTINGDRVMDGGENGKSSAFNAKKAIAKALVVLDKIELVDTSAQVLPRAVAECEGLGERPGHEGSDLDGIAEGLDFRGERKTHREGVVVDVEAWEFDKGDAGIEDWVGLSAVHLDLVAHINKGLREVSGINALTTYMGFTPIGEESDAQGELAVSGEIGAPGGFGAGGHGSSSFVGSVDKGQDRAGSLSTGPIGARPGGRESLLLGSEGVLRWALARHIECRGLNFERSVVNRLVANHQASATRIIESQTIGSGPMTVAIVSPDRSATSC